MSKQAAAQTHASDRQTPPVAVPDSQRKRARFSREEVTSYVVAGAFVVVAIGCYAITGW